MLSVCVPPSCIQMKDVWLAISRCSHYPFHYSDCNLHPHPQTVLHYAWIRKCIIVAIKYAWAFVQWLPSPSLHFFSPKGRNYSVLSVWVRDQDQWSAVLGLQVPCIWFCVVFSSNAIEFKNKIGLWRWWQWKVLNERLEGIKEMDLKGRCMTENRWRNWKAE